MRRQRPLTPPTRLAPILALLVLASIGCRDQALQAAPTETGEYPAGLSPKQAAMVLVKVGDRAITLGDYAAALERMDDFDRLRYRSSERRRELLDEMINVELLAIEAERRGLDREPATQEAIRQVLRDALFRDVRKNARGPQDFRVEEVRAYYDANREEFVEPERRRLSHIVVQDRQRAEELLTRAKATADIEAWGRLVLEHSDEYKGKQHTGPTETAGDLGFVGPPGDPRGANARVPERLRVAIFEVANDGEMVGRVVEDDKGAFHVLRLVATAKSHTRSFEESERTIRNMLTDRELLAAEQQLEADLRKKHPITIDEAALSETKAPSLKLHAPPPQQPKPDEDHDHDHDL